MVEEQILTRWPVTSPLGYPLSACPGLYWTGNDHLKISAYASVASLAVTVAGLFLGIEGVPSPFQVTVTPTSDRAETVSRLRLGEGYLLSLVASISSGSPTAGQCYVSVQRQYGAG